MAEKISRDDFAKYEGTKFNAYLDSEFATEIELIEVTELRVIDRAESFSLIFHAPATAVVVTGVVKMEHGELESIDMGLSPFAQDESTTKYEAVFNYLIGEADVPPPTELESN